MRLRCFVSTDRSSRSPNETYACWPAGPASLDLQGEKTAAASVMSLANNLRANAADIVKAGHNAENGQARRIRQVAKVLGRNLSWRRVGTGLPPPVARAPPG